MACNCFILLNRQKPDLQWPQMLHLSIQFCRLRDLRKKNYIDIIRFRATISPIPNVLTNAHQANTQMLTTVPTVLNFLLYIRPQQLSYLQ
jgi:hypothetical protein